MVVTYRTENEVRLKSDVLGSVLLHRSDAPECRKHPWQIVSSAMHYRTAEDAIAALEQCERSAKTMPGAVVTRCAACEVCGCRINYGRFCGKCEFK